jgi:hypothetical protein
MNVFWLSLESLKKGRHSLVERTAALLSLASLSGT